MSIRQDFERWWEENMNTTEMDLWRCSFPMMEDEDQPYACHETQRGWMAYQAGADAARKEQK